MSILFFLFGGAMAISTCIAVDQYQEAQYYKKKLEKYYEQDLRSNNK